MRNYNVNVADAALQNEKVLNMFIENNGVMIDDHSGEEEHFGAIVFFADPTVGVAGWVPGARYQSLNRVHLKNGKLHLGKDSMAGVVWGKELTTEALDRHNESVIFNSKLISKAVMLDGTIITATAKTIEDDED